MLTQQLRGLEGAASLRRTVHAVVPPHVDYDITALGRTALPAIRALRAWGAEYRVKVRRSNRNKSSGDSTLDAR